MHATATAEDYLQIAIEAVSAFDGYRDALDRLPVPVYITDTDGLVTYWNSACVAFAGREPRLGEDRWCVTWRLYTTSGDPLPHDQCPMAEAIHKQQPIRGKVAIAMRPDGSRAAFVPYPTPLFDSDGTMTGAINLLIDVSAEQATALAEQSARCRRLSRSTNDQMACRMLDQMAVEYAATSAALAGQGDRQPADRELPAGEAQTA